MKATAKDLRFHSKELLSTVNRGKPCAKLVPYDESEKDKKIKSNLFGMWKDNDGIEDKVAGLMDTVPF